MARRDPNQADLFTDATSAPTARTALEQEVLDAIQDILPRGVPTYVREVLRVEQNGRAIVADLIVFDGHMHRLQISGQPGARGYAWLEDPRSPMDCFGWDEGLRQWVRYPEDRYLPSEAA